MKKTFNLLVAFALILLFGSCQNILENNKKDEQLSLDKDFKEVTIDNRYSIFIPNYLKETNQLNTEASLQYQNLYKEAYLIVIDEPKNDFIQLFKDFGEYNDSIPVEENYSNIQLNYLREAIDNFEIVEGPKSVVINELKAESVEVKGALEGIEVTYFINFIEGQKDMYFVMAWTLTDRNNKYRQTFKKAAGTFREL